VAANPVEAAEALKNLYDFLSLANDVREDIKDASTQQAQQAQINSLTRACQALIAGGITVPTDNPFAFELFPLALATGIAAANSAKNSCTLLSQATINAYDTASAELQSQLVTSEGGNAIPFTTLNNAALAGDVTSTNLAATSFLQNNIVPGLSVGTNGISYQQSDGQLSTTLSSDWIPAQLTTTNSGVSSSVLYPGILLPNTTVYVDPSTGSVTSTSGNGSTTGTLVIQGSSGQSIGFDYKSWLNVNYQPGGSVAVSLTDGQANQIGTLTYDGYVGSLTLSGPIPAAQNTGAYFAPQTWSSVSDNSGVILATLRGPLGNADGTLAYNLATGDGTLTWADGTSIPLGSGMVAVSAGPNGTGPAVTFTRNSADDNTSQITTYSADGSSITTDYSGPDGTGSITSQDTENADGTSALTTYNPDGSSVTDDYTGPRGTGMLTRQDTQYYGGTSQIIIYNSDGSSTATDYAGPGGTGLVTEIDQDNSNGTSQITIYNDDRSYTVTDYSGADGAGEVTQIDTYDSSGHRTGGSLSPPSGGGTINIPTGTTEVIIAPGVTGSFTFNNNTGDDVSIVVEHVLANGVVIPSSDNSEFDIFTNYDDWAAAYGNLNNGGDLGPFDDTVAVDPLTLHGAQYTGYAIPNDEDPSLPYYDFTITISGFGPDVSVQGGTITVTPPNDEVLSLDSALSNLSPDAQTIDAMIISGTGTASFGGVISILNLDVQSGELLLSGATVKTDPVTVDASGNIVGYGTITGGETVNGTVTADGGTLDLTGDVGGSGTLTFTPGAALQLEGTVTATGGIIFTGGGEALILGTSADVQVSISGFGPTDAIALEGQQVAAAIYDPTDNQLAVTGSAGSIFDLTFAGTYQQSDFPVTDGEVVMPCFVQGTRIATQRGQVGVEHLRAGDLVPTQFGGMRRVKWLGHRRVNCRRHPKPQKVWPMRVRAGAFADGVPHRDLWLSPDHAVFAENVLIPIKHLINGSTVTQEPREEVTYWHVELEHHDVLLAEGLPCETYLDTGNRSTFDNGGGPPQLHPDFCGLAWEALGCAPLVVTGPALEAVQRRLHACGDGGRGICPQAA
jgi:hypothetical protein